jgi:hypothetical protein
MDENTEILYTILCGSTMSPKRPTLGIENSLYSLMVADSVCPLPIELQCLHKFKYHAVLSAVRITLRSWQPTLVGLLTTYDIGL